MAVPPVLADLVSAPNAPNRSGRGGRDRRSKFYELSDNLPSLVTSSTHHGQVELVWQPPRDGGLPIIYQIIPRPACSTCTGLTTPSTSDIPATTIRGLASGQTYTFMVRAIDAAGTGPASARSNPVTP
jgi:hypothetical protein